VTRKRAGQRQKKKQSVQSGCLRTCGECIAVRKAAFRKPSEVKHDLKECLALGMRLKDLTYVEGHHTEQEVETICDADVLFCQPLYLSATGYAK